MLLMNVFAFSYEDLDISEETQAEMVMLDIEDEVDDELELNEDYLDDDDDDINGAYDYKKAAKDIQKILDEGKELRESGKELRDSLSKNGKKMTTDLDRKAKHSTFH